MLKLNTDRHKARAASLRQQSFLLFLLNLVECQPISVIFAIGTVTP